MNVRKDLDDDDEDDRSSGCKATLRGRGWCLTRRLNSPYSVSSSDTSSMTTSSLPIFPFLFGSKPSKRWDWGDGAGVEVRSVSRNHDEIGMYVALSSRQSSREQGAEGSGAREDDL